MLTLLFLMLHFMVFPSRNEDAGHLFYSHDLNCYYNYIIPNVLNATLVMWLLATDWMRSNDFSLVKKGLLALAVYLALFSNLYSSEILTIFLGCQMLVEMPYKGRGEMLQHLRKNWVKLVVIGLFLVSLVLEYNGGRANWQSRELLEEGDTLPARMATTADILTHTLFSRFFFALVMAMGLYGLWRTVRSRHLSAMAATLMATTAVTFIYVFLLCAKVMPHYIQRPDCLFAVFFPLLLLVCMACAELLRRHRKCTVALPFCLFVVFSRLLNTTYWLDIGQEYGRIDNLQRINAYVLQQFTDADQSYRGDSVTIIVPKADGPQNWPYLTAILNFDSMANTLYRHNVIHRKMVGKVVADKPIDQY